jgi:uncharacterized protein YbbC (DUF1343 family)
MHPIPVLHGLTIGELATMINGEGWLTGKLSCDLRVVKMRNWKHGQPYSPPVRPSPNLPNYQSIMLYPSLCFFEATRVSVGRGTYFPFQVIGFPDRKYGTFSFTPKSLPGYSAKPLQENRRCFGVDLRNVAPSKGFTLSYLIDFYRKSGEGETFFSTAAFMDKLAGTNALRKQIIAGKTETEIRAGWANQLAVYKKMREKYLLYE